MACLFPIHFCELHCTLSPKVTDIPFGRTTYIHIRPSIIDIEPEKKKPDDFSSGLCWRYLSFRPVSRQVLSAEMSLTSVFGMGTGGPSS